MGEAVKKGPGETFRPEDLGPLVEGQIGGYQDGSPFVVLAEDLEVQFGLGVERGVLVNLGDETG